jgi:FkbM family methyltransferase
MPNYPHLAKKVFYSQNREDLILEAFFPDVEKGFYVDVGGYDPDVDSVTKLFYEKGWHGINVEPQPDRFKTFKKRRPKDINLNIGISNVQSNLTLRSYENQGLSTFSEKMQAEYAGSKDEGTQKYTDITIEVKTLKEVFSEHKVKQIHFMKVDVEGLEYEVLEGNDWSKYRPEVVCIESNHIVKDWRGLLKDNGYSLVFNDGLNDYYTDKKTDRHKKFDYVNLLLLGKGGGLRYEDYQLVEGLDKEKSEAQAELVKTRNDLEAGKQKIAILESENSRLSTENQTLYSIKATTKNLVKLLVRNIKALFRK